MRPGLPVAAGAVLFCLSAAPCFAAGLAITGPDGRRQELSVDAFRAMPRTVADPARNRTHRFKGPLLWAVLSQAGAIDPAQFHGQVRQYVTLTGQDGYVALLALSEIAPEFEGKPGIVADGMDGQSLGFEHIRIVVPGHKRGSRGMHDLVSVAVTVLPR